MFLLGFFGTGHCIGMCGPLVLAILAPKPGMAPHLTFHTGRVLTYTIIGCLAGALGGLVLDPAMTHIQVGFSLFAAVVLFGFGLVRLGAIPEPRLMAIATPTRIPGFGKLINRVGHANHPLLMFPIGMMMGLLPCGLSYAAFTKALAAGHPVTGALMVLMFGLGTVPGLLVMGTVASQVAIKYRRLSDILSSLLMIGMAISLGATSLDRLA
ncbi:MAG: sulfite exporter TauE/SafE family protein [Myxococcota bacterium]|nr:sulfite exporter TauE/SafE family protein [Myxococcota bacterium]